MKELWDDELLSTLELIVLRATGCLQYVQALLQRARKEL